MARAIITLTTDFGPGSPYVAEMKGVVLALNPDATLIDVTHGVGPQNVREAALVLESVTRWFPPGTIHMVVVDPGVGTARKLIYARFGEQRYLAPDNGCLSRLALAGVPDELRELTARHHWRAEVSATFHGRDILAPVAARLSLGLDPEQLGPPLADLVHLEWTKGERMGKRIEGRVVAVDSFGNLVTDIAAEVLEPLAGIPNDQITVRCDDFDTQGIFRTYADQPPMTLVALVGSNGRLELALVNDNAHALLGVGVGARVVIEW